MVAAPASDGSADPEDSQPLTRDEELPDQPGNLEFGSTEPQPRDRPTQKQPASPSTEDIPWPSRPGLRIAALRSKVPTVDRVVLVPDEATFLEAISEWSLGGRWPVLFEDDQYAPMFIRRFKPAEVIRKPATQEKLPRNEALEESLRSIVSAAWRGGDKAEPAETPLSTEDRFKQAGWTPPGVVITSTKDDAWPAALALAADRGQPIVFLSEGFGHPSTILKAEDWTRLNTAVDSLVAATGYSYDQLGDDIDTITLVRELPTKYVDVDDPSGNSRNAVTDGLARTGKIRWGIAGWIFGSTTQTTYMAMCSIFLEHESALLFDTYPNQPGWSRYAMNKPADRLRELGLEVQHIASPVATAAAWETLAPSGVTDDLIFVNTKGNQNWFEAADGVRVFVHDVPILNAPAAVHFVHSWSCFSPSSRNTLAGRWLERGAYAYVGSVQEPTLSAFVPPELLVDRLRSAVPFLIAARVWEFAPWRVATIGDPLMIMLKEIPRIGPETRSISGESLREALRRATDSATTSGNWTEVVRIVNLLGLDDLTLSIYNQRLKDAAPAEDIALALGAIFRKSDAQTFLHAIEQIPVSQLTPEQRDMLWLKCLPSLRAINSPAQLALLRLNIRTPLGYVDACRLAPLMKSQGQASLVNPMLDEYESDAKEKYAKDLIRRARP